jgi:predicted TIM-barrel fold metal-dependent hydrolase
VGRGLRTPHSALGAGIMPKMPIMDEIPVIDADGHVEPAIAADWWRYVPGPDGPAVAAKGARIFDRIGDFSGTRRGAWDAAARLADMDAEGIRVAVLFGGDLGLTGSLLAHPERGTALARGYNDWLADYCAAAPERLKGVALLPLQDMPAAIAELERAVSRFGFVSGLLGTRVGECPLDDPVLDPLYAAAEALDLPLSIHGGDIQGNNVALRYPTFSQRHALGFPISLMTAVMDIACGGVLDRHPRLRLSFLEAGAGWLPYWLDRLDEHWERRPNHVPHMRRSARETWGEGRLYISCDPDEWTLPQTVELLGAATILYASDYPHWDSAFPESARLIAHRAELTDEAKRKILCENAQQFYGTRLLPGHAGGEG